MSRPLTSSSQNPTSSSLFSASRAHKLHRVAFHGEDSAHWALLLPVKTGSSVGLVVHIGVRKDPLTLEPIRHELRMPGAFILGTAAEEARVIPGAEVTEAQLEEAANAVFN